MGFIEKVAKAFGFKEPEKQRPNLFQTTNWFEEPTRNANAYLDTYKTDNWVYACVKVISQEFAAQMAENIKLWRKKGEDVEEVYDHPVLALLYNVNNYTTSYQLWEATQAYTDLTGDAFWYLPKYTKGGEPAEIYVLRPDWMSIMPSKTELIDYYEYHVPGIQPVRFEKEEIIQKKNFNPTNFYRGLSTLSALAYAVDTDIYATKYNMNFFKNNAQPEGGLTTPNNLTEEQVKRIAQQWEALHQGVDNSHRAAILSGGLHWEEIGIKQKDMDFIEGRKFTRDEIFAVFRVPKSVLGIVEDVNRANAEASNLAFVKWAIVPRMRDMVSFLNEFLLPKFQDGEDLYFTFEDPTPENRELLIQENQSGVSTGYMTINEARAKVGLEPLQNGGNDVYQPFNMSPVGNVAPPVKVYKPRVKFPPLSKNKRIRKEIKELVNKKINDLVNPKKSKIKDETIDKKRENVWRRYVDMYSQYSVDLKGIIKGLFLTQKQDIQHNLTKKAKRKVDDVLFDKDKEAKRFADGLTPRVTAIVQTEGEYAMNQVGSRNKYQITPNQRKYIDEVMLKDMTEINETTRQKLKDEIIEGLEIGESISELQKRIEDVYEDIIKYRSEMIARTESQQWVHEGQIDGWKESGVVSGKEWITAYDERTCEDCQDNDGKIIELDEDYYVKGDELPSGAQVDYRDIGEPPLHPDCRCTIAPITFKSGKVIKKKIKS